MFENEVMKQSINAYFIEYIYYHMIYRESSGAQSIMSRPLITPQNDTSSLSICTRHGVSTNVYVLKSALSTFFAVLEGTL